MLGKYYKIKFLDHAKDTLNHITCVCFGKMLVDEPTHYGFCWWDVEDMNEDETSHNQEIFCIVKSAVIELKEL